MLNSLWQESHKIVAILTFHVLQGAFSHGLFYRELQIPYDDYSHDAGPDNNFSLFRYNCLHALYKICCVILHKASAVGVISDVKARNGLREVKTFSKSQSCRVKPDV